MSQPGIRLSRRADGVLHVQVDPAFYPHFPSTQSHHAPNQHSSGQLGKIFDPALILPEIQCGGEMGISSLHWISNDSIAAQQVEGVVAGRLWEGWCLLRGKELQDKMISDEMQIRLSLDAAMEDPKQLVMHYHRGIPFHEELVRSHFLRAIEVIEESLSAAGYRHTGASAFDRLNRKRATSKGKVAGLRVCVGRAEGFKTKGNAAGQTGKHDLAVRHYLDGLLALWPWTAGVAMTFEQASDAGLIKIEQALLLNIAAVALAASPKNGPKRKALDKIIQVTCGAVLQLRYATYGSLTKAFDRLAQIEERAEQEGVSDEKSDNAGDSGIFRLMASLFEGKPADQWAHKFCVRGHVCHD